MKKSKAMNHELKQLRYDKHANGHNIKEVFSDEQYNLLKICQLTLELNFKGFRASIGFADAVARVDDEIAVKCELMFAVQDVNAEEA